MRASGRRGLGGGEGARGGAGRERGWGRERGQGRRGPTSGWYGSSSGRRRNWRTHSSGVRPTWAATSSHLRRHERAALEGVGRKEERGGMRGGCGMEGMRVEVGVGRGRGRGRRGVSARGGGACAAHRSSNCSRPSSSAIVASGVHSFSSPLAAPEAARYALARDDRLAPQPSASGRASGAVAPTAALAGPSSNTVVPSCAPLACGLCER